MRRSFSLLFLLLSSVCLIGCNWLASASEPVAYYSEGGSPVYVDEIFSDRELNEIAYEIAQGISVENRISSIEINAQGRSGISLLWIAVRFGRIETARMLLSNGANPNMPTDYVETIMIKAAKGSSEMLATLLAHGGDPNDRSPSPDERPVIHFAAGVRSKRNVDILLNAGANIDARDSRGGTALFDASVTRALNMVLYLLNKGANPELRNEAGFSFLEIILAQRWDEEGMQKIDKIKDWLRTHGYDLDALLERQRGGNGPAY